MVFSHALKWEKKKKKKTLEDTKSGNGCRGLGTLRANTQASVPSHQAEFYNRQIYKPSSIISTKHMTSSINKYIYIYMSHDKAYHRYTFSHIHSLPY